MPAVSMMGLRKSAELQLGTTFNDIIYFSKPMVSRHGFLTANNNVPYVMTVSGLLVALISAKPVPGQRPVCLPEFRPIAQC
ncbi:MAG: hypothetical protein WCC25_00105 [Candidatus Korobacteraceae bacterium]